MASASKRGFGFRRRAPAPVRTFHVSSPGRSAKGPWGSSSLAARFDIRDRQFALTASAARLSSADQQEAKVQRMLRQGWQSDAWNYRDSIGELRYASNFLADVTSRMRIYPACYGIGGESDLPKPLDEVEGIPDNLASVCAQAMGDLGNGRMAISGMIHTLSANKGIAGEWYLLGRADAESGAVHWRVCSVDELVVYDAKWMLREIPDDRQNGIVPWIDLSKDPIAPVISRVWTPHPRFQLLADSPMRAMLDDCETLMILRRMMRGEGRSRLASAGMVAIPDEFSIKAPVDDDDDPDADPFFNQLSRAMETGITNEGDASAVVPIVIRGPGDRIKQIQYFDFARKFDAEARQNRAELVGVIATTWDLPKEVIMGLADLNHWTAWAVDDSTFRQIEPHVIGCCDDLAGAFLRPYLAAAGIPDFWVQRCCFWYDPTEVVTHPDRTKDAQTAYDAMALSGEALRREYGFSEEDKPSIQELEERRVMDIRALPLNLLMEYASRADPSLVVPAMTGPPQLPGIRPGGGVDVGAQAPGQPGAPVLPAGPTPPPAPAPDSVPGPPPIVPPKPGPPPITAAGAAAGSNARLSRKLAAIDADLRARLQTAANAALLRALERAGSRVRTKVAKDETLRSKIAHRANERVTAILGPATITAAGLSADDLISGSEAWGPLRAQFMAWTAAAQEQALKTALRIGDLDEDSAAAVRAAQAMAAGREAGWALLAEAMTSLSHHLLYSPDPNVGPGDWADLNPDTLVPAGTIRAALGVAGGASASTALLEPATGAVSTTGYVGQIGTGSTIGDLIASTGTRVKGYEWVHGPALHPFEPHLALDGVEFERFDDPRLANDSGFPDNAYYFPGDHEGDSCDFMPIYLTPGE